LNDVLLQYGALGVLALLALSAVRILFQREIKAHEQETARANRLEAELGKLNQTIQTQYITTLTQATMAMSQAVQFMREVGDDADAGQGRRRGGGRGKATYPDQQLER
jgi:hypothetical protein